MMEENTTNQKKNWLLSLDMKPFLQKAWDTSGFKTPTPIQEGAIPLILQGKDVIAESPTGTGKTLAYLIPLLHKIDVEGKNIQVVILAPSHELSMQIFQTIQEWTKGSDIRSAVLIGGANIKRQIENLKTRPQIVVATTGRLLEIIKMKKVKMHEVKTIVVDEFDVLVAQEHVDFLKNIIKTTLRERQLVCFSATLSQDTEEIGKELMKEPEVIQINRDESGKYNTEHLYILCEERDKIEVLRKVIRAEEGRTLAFINDVDKISEIAAKLEYKGIDLAILTADSGKNQRKEALKNFRRGKFPLLIATDVAARGLDIEGLTHVIHWDLPRSANQYLHRSGRTGRMGAMGTVISIVTKAEETPLRRITNKLGLSLKKKKMYRGKIIDSK